MRLDGRLQALPEDPYVRYALKGHDVPELGELEPRQIAVTYRRLMVLSRLPFSDASESAVLTDHQRMPSLRFHSGPLLKHFVELD